MCPIARRSPRVPVHSALPIGKPAPVTAGEVILKGGADARPRRHRTRSCCIRKRQGDVLRRARGERTDPRQAHARHIIPGGQDVGLHSVGCGFGRISGRHHAFIERAGGTISVVTTCAEENASPLVHRVVAVVSGRAGANATVDGRQATTLRVARAEIPPIVTPPPPSTTAAVTKRQESIVG